MWQNSRGQPVQDHLVCFEALALMVDEILRVCRLQSDPDELQQRVKTYLSCYKALYGEDWMPLKFHYLHHFVKHIRKWGKIGLPNCFCLERKHKGVKRFANNLYSLRDNWDASVLREVTCMHMHGLHDRKKFSLEHGLIDGKPAGQALQAQLRPMFPNVGVFKYSLEARCNEWEIVHKGDVVVLRSPERADKHVAGEVMQHISYEVGGAVSVCTLVRMLGYESRVNNRCSLHRVCNLAWVRTNTIVRATTFAKGSRFRIIEPVRFKPRW